MSSRPPIRSRLLLGLACLLPLAQGCADQLHFQGPPKVVEANRPRSFGEDLTFLRKHTQVIVLEGDDKKSRIVVAPEYQGRVMTSTAEGDQGMSFGYLNHQTISLHKRTPPETLLGGEDRFGLGPEGGQFGLFFEQNAPFDLEHFQVPEPLDWGAWTVTAQTAKEVSFQKEMVVKNHSGATFSLRVDRTIRLLGRERILSMAGGSMDPSLHVVAYESENVVTNTGERAWSKETGLISIAVAARFNPTPKATVAIPIKGGATSMVGPMVIDDYLGKVSLFRLRAPGSFVAFRVDGRERGKIGIAKARAKNVVLSYDPKNRLLTVIELTVPRNMDDYVNSKWEQQAAPYAGAVVHCHNDGPVGASPPSHPPYYEIATSSPALALSPGESARHVHTTLHVTGAADLLDEIVRARLGSSLVDVVRALP